jgi:uncharacterized protein (TIGR02678 family)
MADVALADHLADERALAIRLLLATPLLDVDADPDAFRVVVRHQPWLTAWFEQACGWGLAVDPAGGFARLAKRSADVDPSRPLKRTRGAAQPFDRRRYQLLCLCCAELVRHPVTTVGLLAGTISAESGLDTSRHGERAAFVDALRALVEWGALRATAGDVDAFLDSNQGNAILTADTARLHRLLVSATAPSRLPDDLDTDSAIASLLVEPRYGDAALSPEASDEEQRLRWARHSVARKLLDDPVVHLEDLSAAERDYLASPSGRRWLRERVADAGFELEERAEGLLAVDPSGIATDVLFPGPHGNAHQLALLLIDRLTAAGQGNGGRERAGRSLGTLSASELSQAVAEVLERFPNWARSHREGDGPQRLGELAVDLLAGFGLVTRSSDGTVVARPAAARYRVGEAKVTQGEPTLFDEEAPWTTP